MSRNHSHETAGPSLPTPSSAPSRSVQKSTPILPSMGTRFATNPLQSSISPGTVIRSEPNSQDKDINTDFIARSTRSKPPGFDFAAVGLCFRCNLCHLRRRTCRGGTPTSPCDTCRRRGLLCRYSKPGSYVDKYSVLIPALVPEQEHLEAAEIGGGELKPWVAQDYGYLTFTPDQVQSGDNGSAHPWETLAARHMLAHELMAYQEDAADVEMKDV